jgi:beta-glucosidase
MTHDVDKLVAELTLDEKVLLTAGADLWSTVPIERLGIPKVRLTDGPNGARGPVVPGEGTTTSVCVPCGSALGATWDPALIEEVGALLGREARRKQCRVLLAPTVNIHRSPLAGRNFECYSEDPLLSGRIAAAYVKGVQGQGVATTVKHFVGNDAEFERHTINSVIDDRALREIYLTPFEIAVKEGGTLGIMTGYNRLNGPWCAEDEWLLRDVLRGEWGYDGFVVSDWFAMGSTVGSAVAGLDLEMPGPGRFFGPALAAAVRAGDVDEALVDEQVGRLLSLWDRLGALDNNDDSDEPQGEDTNVVEVTRRAAAAAVVLLTNDGILPLDGGTIAIIGPNADRPQIMGGGSANFRPQYRVSPLHALQERFGATRVTHARGCDIDRAAPPLIIPFAVELFDDPDFESDVVARIEVPDSRLMWFSSPDPRVSIDSFSARATGTFTPDESGAYTFTLVQAGRARLLVDGVVVIDGIADPPPRGTQLFGLGSAEVSATVDLVAGTDHKVTMEYSSAGAFIAHGVVIGHRRPVPADMLEQAAATAAAADVAVVIVGTNSDWESEGYDRADMRLPGRQDELVAAVIAANPNTVVIVNTGAPVQLDWAADARAVLQAWFGGQEMANALAEILAGDTEPGGRLPTTLPLCVEHNPSYGNFPGENGEVRYGEGVLVGYRWYEARHLAVRFPFGHGLSYTTFTIGAPKVSAAGRRVEVTVEVTNTGPRAGSEVVQCYVAPTKTRLMRPPKELKAFAKVHLEPGASTTVALVLEERAFAYWDPGQPDWAELRQRVADTTRNPPPGMDRTEEPGWRVDPGDYVIHVGRSSADIAHTAIVSM